MQFPSKRQLLFLTVPSHESLLFRNTLPVSSLFISSSLSLPLSFVLSDYLPELVFFSKVQYNHALLNDTQESLRF